MFSQSRINQLLFVSIIIFAIIAGWAVSELFNSKQDEPSNNITLKFEATDHFGNEVSTTNYDGFSKVFFFGFTHCPDICPITMKQLQEVKSQLEGKTSKEFRVFLVSVDPDRDTPENLRIYLDNFNKEFIGLTGRIDQIYKFSTQVNAPFFPVVNSQEDNYTVDHSGSLVLINPEAKYSGFFRAPHSADKLSKALASLLR